MSPEANAYVEHVIGLAQEGFLYSSRVDWPAVCAGVLERCAGASTTLETHKALGWMAEHLNTFLEVPHTFFWPKRVESAPGELEPAFVPPRGQRLEGGFGYVWMPSVVREADVRAYPDVLQGVIAEIDAEPTRGWIVDLRDNDGGNCWPMLAGIGPVLGEGVCGGFEGPDGSRSLWSYQHGSSGCGGEAWSSVTGEPYHLKLECPPVTVLIGPTTSSSGEIVAISFVGRERTQFFGRPTGGASTANDVHSFEDGARLIITSAHDLDRHGHRYGHPIQPDELVPDGWDSLEPRSDDCVRRAVAWLVAQG